jgi:hypothetical protein
VQQARDAGERERDAGEPAVAPDDVAAAWVQDERARIGEHHRQQYGRT